MDSLESSVSVNSQQLICAICLETWVNKVPRLLPCAHTFCHECLEDFGEKSKNGIINCPTCRKSIKFQNANDFPVNFYFSEARQGGSISRSSSFDQNNLCLIHNAVATLICITCNFAAVCRECTAIHPAHDICGIQDFLMTAKTNLQSKKIEYEKEKEKFLQQARKEYDKRKERIDNHYTELCRKISFETSNLLKPFDKLYEVKFDYSDAKQLYEESKKYLTVNWSNWTDSNKNRCDIVEVKTKETNWFVASDIYVELDKSFSVPSDSKNLSKATGKETNIKTLDTPTAPVQDNNVSLQFYDRSESSFPAAHSSFFDEKYLSECINADKPIYVNLKPTKGSTFIPSSTNHRTFNHHVKTSPTSPSQPLILKRVPVKEKSEDVDNTNVREILRLGEVLQCYCTKSLKNLSSTKYGLFVHFKSDERRLVHLHDPSTFDLITEIDRPLKSICFDMKSKSLFALDMDDQILFCNNTTSDQMEFNMWQYMEESWKNIYSDDFSLLILQNSEELLFCDIRCSNYPEAIGEYTVYDSFSKCGGICFVDERKLILTDQGENTIYELTINEDKNKILDDRLDLNLIKPRAIAYSKTNQEIIVVHGIYPKNKLTVIKKETREIIHDLLLGYKPKQMAYFENEKILYLTDGKILYSYHI